VQLSDLQLPAAVGACTYTDAGQLAEALALQVAQALRQAIEQRGSACLLVSGGRSPLAFFQALAQQPLPWARVMISLADERWVAPEHADSNEALVRRNLLQGSAASAQFLGLYQPAASLEAATELADTALAALPPVDVLVLGMGEDGHCASLFPGSPLLALALERDCPRRVLPMQAPVAPTARLSLTLPLLASARLPLLAIQGPAKLATLEQALAGSDALQMPIRALLKAPLQIHWCP